MALDVARSPASAEVGPRRLDPLLRPRSVVVVGASPNPSFVSAILNNLRHAGYTGPIAAVNPRYDSVGGVMCYRSVLDVPWPIDLVVVGVAWRAVPALLDQCEQKRVGALVVITSGYAESGGQGIGRQDDLSAWARRTGTPVSGPNCLGLMHAPSGLHVLPSTFTRVVPGQVGLVLQSGMMAPSVLTPLFARNIGVTFAVTSGNEADVDLAEYIRYFVDDDETRVIGCFAEQIKRPAAFLNACELAADARKPIVMLKIGRSEAAQRAALAHTGSLVGADAVIDAVLTKVGVTRVSNVDEMFEALAVFHTRRLPRGDGLAAVSVSGGAAGLISDLAAECGVRFPTLTDETQRKLREVVPEFGTVGNPLDVTGQGVFQPQLLEASLDLLAADPDVDAIVYARPFPAPIDATTPAYHALERAIQSNPDTPFLVMSLSGGHFFPSPIADTPVLEPLDRVDGVPFLQGAAFGLRAVGALARYSAFLRLRQRLRPGQGAEEHTPVTSVLRTARGGLSNGEFARTNSLRQSQSRAIIQAASGPRLSAREGTAVLAAYGIPTPPEALATTPREAAAAASTIGYPVVAKVEAPGLAHKASAGGVALNLRNEAEVEAAFERVRQVAEDAEGVLIQHMIDGGRAEVIVGMSRDPQFGPVVACGLGGVLVETLRDVQLLLPPLTPEEARAALGRLRAAPLLGGADHEAVVDVLIRFSELCLDLQDVLQAVDLNPLIVRAPGQGVCAVDSLFELRRQSA